MTTYTSHASLTFKPIYSFNKIFLSHCKEIGRYSPNTPYKGEVPWENFRSFNIVFHHFKNYVKQNMLSDAQSHEDMMQLRKGL